MKKTIFLFAVILLAITTYAQDLIIRTKGKCIKCKITSTDTANVYFTYKACWDCNLISSYIDRSKVDQLQYNNKQVKKQVDDSLYKINEALLDSIKHANHINLSANYTFNGGMLSVSYSRSHNYNKYVKYLYGAGLGMTTHFNYYQTSSYWAPYIPLNVNLLFGRKHLLDLGINVILGMYNNNTTYRPKYDVEYVYDSENKYLIPVAHQQSFKKEWMLYYFITPSIGYRYCTFKKHSLTFNIYYGEAPSSFTNYTRLVFIRNIIYMGCSIGYVF